MNKFIEKSINNTIITPISNDEGATSPFEEAIIKTDIAFIKGTTYDKDIEEDDTNTFIGKKMIKYKYHIECNKLFITNCSFCILIATFIMGCIIFAKNINK